MKYLILILLMFVSVGAGAADFRMSLYNAKEPYEIENIILEVMDQDNGYLNLKIVMELVL